MRLLRRASAEQVIETRGGGLLWGFAPRSTGVMAWFIWAIVTAFVLLQFCSQAATGVITHELMHDFHLSAMGVGALSASFFYTFILLQLFVGFFFDRFGARFILTGASLSLALGSILFGVAHVLWLAFLGRILMGLGASFAFVGMLCLVATWFPPRKFALVIGWSEMLGMLGTGFGMNVLSQSVLSIGWRHSLIGFGCIVLILPLIIVLWVQDKPPQELATTEQELEPLPTLGRSLFYVVSSKQNWLLGLYGFFMFSVVNGFSALWSVPFLMTKYGMTLDVATFATSLVFIGIAASSPLQGWLSMYLGCRRPLMMFGALATFVNLSLVIYCPLSLGLVLICLFLSGFMCSPYLQVFSVAKELNPRGYRSISMGFANMMTMVGALVLQPLIGWFLYLGFGHHGPVVAASFYVGDYQWALTILPVGMLLAVVCAYFITETHCMPR